VEQEPNDRYQAPVKLDGAVCGDISSDSDADWYTWTIDRKGVPYTVEVTGDAEILLWRKVNGRYSQVRNTTSKSVVGTSSSAAQYVLLVQGPAAASYRVALTTK
jgi:hypothetical protein